MKKLWLSCLLISLLANAVLEGQALIRVLNKETREAVPYATVSFENIYTHEKTGAITNEKGELTKPLKGATIIKISSVGYIQATDTIHDGSQKEILLTPSDIMTDDVVVTASAKPQLRDKSIYKIDVIPNAKIRERAAVNLADLLSTQLGIRVEQNGSLGSSIRIQGLFGEQVKILMEAPSLTMTML